MLSAAEKSGPVKKKVGVRRSKSSTGGKARSSSRTVRRGSPGKKKKKLSAAKKAELERRAEEERRRLAEEQERIEAERREREERERMQREEEERRRQAEAERIGREEEEMTSRMESLSQDIAALVFSEKEQEQWEAYRDADESLLRMNPADEGTVNTFLSQVSALDSATLSDVMKIKAQSAVMVTEMERLHAIANERRATSGNEEEMRRLERQGREVILAMEAKVDAATEYMLHRADQFVTSRNELIVSATAALDPPTTGSKAQASLVPVTPAPDEGNENVETVAVPRVGGDEGKSNKNGGKSGDKDGEEEVMEGGSAIGQACSGLWVNVAKNPRVKNIDYPKLGLRLEVPKSIALASVAIRMDYLPPERLIWATDAPLLTKLGAEKVPPAASTSNAGGNGELSMGAPMSTGAAVAAPILKHEPGEVDDGAEAEPEAERAFDPDREFSCLEHVYPIGGLVSLDLLSLPPPPKKVKGWTLRTVPNQNGSGLTRLSYPLAQAGGGAFGHGLGGIGGLESVAGVTSGPSGGAPSTPNAAPPAKEGLASSASAANGPTTTPGTASGTGPLAGMGGGANNNWPPLRVTTKVPPGVLVDKEPEVAAWDGSRKVWTKEAVSGVEWNSEERLLSFGTMSVGFHSLVIPRSREIPLQAWSLRPAGETRALFELMTATSLKVVIEIHGKYARLARPTFPELAWLKNEKLRPTQLLRALAQAGLNLIPDESAAEANSKTMRRHGEDALPRTGPKEAMTEADLHQAISMVVPGWAFAHSKWNSSRPVNKAVVRAREFLDWNAPFSHDEREEALLKALLEKGTPEELGGGLKSADKAEDEEGGEGTEGGEGRESTGDEMTGVWTTLVYDHGEHTNVVPIKTDERSRRYDEEWTQDARIHPHLYHALRERATPEGVARLTSPSIEFTEAVRATLDLLRPFSFTL